MQLTSLGQRQMVLLLASLHLIMLLVIKNELQMPSLLERCPRIQAKHGCWQRMGQECVLGHLEQVTINKCRTFTFLMTIQQCHVGSRAWSQSFVNVASGHLLEVWMCNVQGLNVKQGRLIVAAGGSCFHSQIFALRSPNSRNTSHSRDTSVNFTQSSIAS